MLRVSRLENWSLEALREERALYPVEMTPFCANNAYTYSGFFIMWCFGGDLETTVLALLAIFRIFLLPRVTRRHQNIGKRPTAMLRVRVRTANQSGLCFMSFFDIRRSTDGNEGSVKNYATLLPP